MVSIPCRPEDINGADCRCRHWIFIIAAILVAINGVLAVAMRESRPALALRHKVEAIVKATGCSGLRAPDDATFPGMRDFMRTTFLMPVRLFFTDPIVSLAAIMGATVVRQLLNEHRP